MILDAAFAMFIERGYEGSSMDAIARKAGVTKPVIYDCYASKGCSSARRSASSTRSPRRCPTVRTRIPSARWKRG